MGLSPDFVRIVGASSQDAARTAAQIWAASTARRDALADPLPYETKLVGIESAPTIPGASLSLALRETHPTGFVITVPDGLELTPRQKVADRHPSYGSPPAAEDAR